MSKDDVISRKWLLDGKRTVYITDRFDGRTSAYISKKTVEDAPSVTQKSGRWKVMSVRLVVHKYQTNFL